MYIYFYCARNCNEFFTCLLQVNITDHEKQTISKTESFITYKIETTVSLRTWEYQYENLRVSVCEYESIGMRVWEYQYGI